MEFIEITQSSKLLTLMLKIITTYLPILVKTNFSFFGLI